MTTHLALQRPLLPTAQVSALTTGSITLPSARGVFNSSKDYELIAATTVGSDTSTVTFSSISSNYTHLILMGVARTGNANTNGSFQLRWNGGTSTDTYGPKQQMYKIVATSTYGNSGTIAQNGAYVPCCGNSATSTTYGHFRVFIPNYRDTGKYRGAFVNAGYDTNTVSNGSLDDGTITQVGTTSSTSAALTSMELYSASNIMAGSRFNLYGVQ